MSHKIFRKNLKLLLDITGTSSLSIQQLEYLSVVHESNNTGILISDIVNILNIPKASVSKYNRSFSIKIMGDKAFIRLELNPMDVREKFVYMTDYGNDILSRVFLFIRD